MVSIIIPCFNAEEWIKEAIDSALGQSWKDIEVIVIDDGSTDGSLAVIEGFGDRIRCESGPNQGGAAARNRGLELARGRRIQFLDADDLLLPDCIERKITAGGREGVVPCSGCEFMDFVSRNGELGGPACWMLAEHDVDTILSTGAPSTTAPLHEREHLVRVGGFRAGLPCAQEFDLHLRLAAVLGLRFESVGGVGVRIRPHYASVSRTAGRKMHYWIAESLLHGAELLDGRGQLTEQRRVVASQRVIDLARRVSQEGGGAEAAQLARGARDLSPRWHERAYRHPLAAALAKGIGFERYEALNRRLKRIAKRNRI